MVSYVFLPNTKDIGRFFNPLFIKTTCALCIAIWEALLNEIPIVAFAKAGASLIPSPTIATLRPRCCACCKYSSFAAGVIALGLCFGAYATEVFRGAILAIPKGHREAGVALGLSKFRIFTKLIMPQMWRIALPGLGNLFMILMKDTALVSVIGLEEIMRHSQIAVTVSKQPFTFYMVAAFMYLGLTVLAMTGMHFLEKRAARGFARSAQ